MKKSITIGVGIGITIIIILGLSWVIGSNVEKTSSPSGINNSSSIVSSHPAGKTYHLNFSESVGIKAQP